jgi:hypothetical protein
MNWMNWTKLILVDVLLVGLAVAFGQASGWGSRGESRRSRHPVVLWQATTVPIKFPALRPRLSESFRYDYYQGRPQVTLTPIQFGVDGSKSLTVLRGVQYYSIAPTNYVDGHPLMREDRASHFAERWTGEAWEYFNDPAAP